MRRAPSHLPLLFLFCVWEGADLDLGYLGLPKSLSIIRCSRLRGLSRQVRPVGVSGSAPGSGRRCERGSGAPLGAALRLGLGLSSSPSASQKQRRGVGERTISGSAIRPLF